MKEYTDKILKEGLRLRRFQEDNVTESTWHRDETDRLVEVIKGKGWKIQVDNRLPILMKEGDVYRIPARMWHRVIPATGDLTILIKEEVAINAMDIFGVDVEDVIDELGEDFSGPLSPGLPTSMTQDILLPEAKKKSNHEPGYKAPEGSARDKKLDAAKAAYKRGDVQTAISIRDEMEKTAREKPGFSSKKSKYTDESKQPAVYPSVMSELEALTEDVILEGLGAKTRASLKKKAKDSNAPLGALSTVYRKGLGAFYSSGSRPGMNAHGWAMARVNSFLKGGKARQVDAAQWKQVQKFRKKN